MLDIQSRDQTEVDTMANMIENLGLGFLSEDEETANGFIGMIISEGKVFRSYYDAMYIQRTFKDAEFVVRCEAGTNEEGKEGYAITGLDSHCSGPCVWDTITEIDITPEDADCTERRLLVRNNTGEGGIAVVNLVNADVLPSFLRGENIKMQIVGFPLRIDFYENEDAMFEDMDEPEAGKKMVPMEGAVIPANFLRNHDPKNSDGGNKQDDEINIIRGTVTKIYGGRFVIEEETMETFLRVFVDTHFGEIELEVSKDMLRDRKQDFKVGDQVLAAVILSGDVGIYEYDEGMVRDEEHDLSAVRYSTVKGEGTRLKSILSEECRYISNVGKWHKKGRDEVVQLFDYVSSANSWDYIVHKATLTEPADEEFAKEAKYLPGRRCLILENENNDYESIMFLSYDDNGDICEIEVINESRYRFVVDEASVYRSDGSEDDGAEESGKKPSMGELAIYCYETILEKLKDIECTNNEEFEIIPAMYILADITASSNGLNRAKIANEIIDTLKEKGYLKDSDLKKLDDRADLYGAIVRNEIVPKAVWWTGDNAILEKIQGNPINRVIFALGDLLIDERLQDDYEETTGISITDIFSLADFSYAMTDTVRIMLMDFCVQISMQ